MQIEHITWEGLAPWWTAEQQTHLAVGDGVLGEVVVDHQRMATVITEVLAHSSTGVWRKIEQRSWVARAGCHHDSLIHHTFFFEALNQASNLAQLLPNGNVDIDHASLLTGLVDHRVECNCRLTGLAITNDQLALAPANREHRIDAHNTSHQWLVHTLAAHHTDRLALYQATLRGSNSWATIKRFTEWVYHAAKQLLANWHTQHLALELNAVASGYTLVAAKQHRANFIFHQVESKCLNDTCFRLDLEHLAIASVAQAMYPGHTITHSGHDTDLL